MDIDALVVALSENRSIFSKEDIEFLYYLIMDMIMKVESA